MKDSFENLLTSSKRKPNLIETDWGKKIYSSTFENFSNKKNIKHTSKNSSLGAVFAGRFNRTNRDLLKKPVFEKSDKNFSDGVSKITKQYNDRVHTSTKLTPIQASSKKNEGYVYHNLVDKRKRIKPKFKIHDLVTTADLKRTFSKENTSNWSHKRYEITESINDAIPSYQFDILLERYNKALLKMIKLSMKKLMM